MRPETKTYRPATVWQLCMGAFGGLVCLSLVLVAANLDRMNRGDRQVNGRAMAELSPHKITERLR